MKVREEEEVERKVLLLSENATLPSFFFLLRRLLVSIYFPEERVNGDKEGNEHVRRKSEQLLVVNSCKGQKMHT